MAEPVSHDELVLLYHSGELKAPDRESFKTHLAICAECRTTLDDLSASSRLAQEALLTPSAAGVATALGRTRPEQNAARGRWERAKAWGIGLGLAFASALLASRLYRGSSRSREPAWRSGLDSELSDLDRRLDRLDVDLSQDAWPVEFGESWENLSRRQRGLERQLAKPEGA